MRAPEPDLENAASKTDVSRIKGANNGLAWLPRVACLVVSVGAMWFVFRKLDFPALQKVLSNMRVGWFLGALLLFGFGCALTGWRWHLMLRLNNCEVSLPTSTRLVFIGHFFNTVLLGPSGGDFAKAALYKRWYGYQLPEILTAGFLDRLLGLAGLVLCGGLAFGVALMTNSLSALEKVGIQTPRKMILAGLVAGIFGIIALRFRHRYFPNSVVVRTLNALIDGLLRLAATPRLGIPGLLLGFIVQAAMSGVLALSLQAVSHQPLPWAQLLWTLPMISLIAAAPITVSGSGVREGASLVLLSLYGVPGTDAVAASLLTLAIFTSWGAFGGILWWWESKVLASRSGVTNAQLISVVIPTLNEAEALPETVAKLREAGGIHEILVVDGGSTDGTIALAEDLGCRVLNSPKGRGGQMRLGAKEAQGDVVLLLHADTWLPPGAGEAILKCLRDPTVVGGGFWKVFREPSFLMLGSRPRCALRLMLAGRLVGDQAIFIRRQSLEAIGGVPDMPLMEEFELCRRLRKRGRLALADATVSTSIRRFAKFGVWRTYLRMWRVTLQYQMGTSSQRLQEIYERD